ncbi:MAG: transcriptional regulator NrdR [Dehalococcoidales bacterium]|nr:transcriptional regulator NrdR [Dehalococcoidales bacterium]
MKCPLCSFENSKVLDSRESPEGIRRRRECLRCGGRFTTYERIQAANLFVIKKDKRREAFQKTKIFNGLRKACEKRPIPALTIENLANEIEADLYSLGKTEISSTIIGDMVMSKLKRLDHIAYIRFASIYRDFADITRLKQEVDTLAVTSENTPPSTQLPLPPEIAAGSAVNTAVKTAGGRRH